MESEVYEKEKQHVYRKESRGSAARGRAKRKRKIVRCLLVLFAFLLGVAFGVLSGRERKASGSGNNKKSSKESSSGRIYETAEKVTDSPAPTSTESAMATQAAGDGRKVLIDAGHGFDDIGTSSEFLSVPEKDITIAMAKLLKEELESRGIAASLTHDGMTFPAEADVMREAERLNLEFNPGNFSANNIFSAYERTIWANVLNKEQGYSVFISLHVNAVESGSASGFQLDYCSGNAYSQRSQVFAEAVNNSLYRSFPETKMKFKADEFADAFIVTKYSEMPSMLLEMGYATDRTDAANLMSDEWRSNFVKAVADGIEAGL